MNYFWSSASETPGNQAFVERYQAKYGIEPGPWAAVYVMFSGKGGSGKTTFAFHLAVAAELSGKTIALIDFDPPLSDFTLNPKIKNLLEKYNQKKEIYEKRSISFYPNYP